MTHDILYTFRRCPYAMRARLALKASGLNPEVREITLRDKPQEMLDASPKGTVPVLVQNNGKIIDESLDIMMWALQQNDPENWLEPHNDKQDDLQYFIEQNDQEFKHHLDRFKYPNRYADNDSDIKDLRRTSKAHVLNHFEMLNHRLQDNNQQFIISNHFSIADALSLPFVRQAANIDREWFDQLPVPFLQKWLHNFLQSELFLSIMPKLKPWSKTDKKLLFNKIT